MEYVFVVVAAAQLKKERKALSKGPHLHSFVWPSAGGITHSPPPNLTPPHPLTSTLTLPHRAEQLNTVYLNHWHKNTSFFVHAVVATTKRNSKVSGQSSDGAAGGVNNLSSRGTQDSICCDESSER